jgi:threonylcarbamoyladenosine tRNA methylthiotransferase MtaB
VLEQVRELVAGGYVEIVLTGVHLGDYGLDLPGNGRSLVDLVSEILELPGLQRFRLSSIEPASVSDALIELMAGNEKFARHFHIPLQSASNAILERMQRRYTREQFSELVLKIADAVPDCGLGTDVICGFPGESDADFQATFDSLAALPITYVHPFSYSVRPGSQAERYGDGVPGDVKKRRTGALKRLMRDKHRAFRERHVGSTLPVLIETSRRARHTHVAGWTDNYLRVELGDGAGAGDRASDRPGELAGALAMVEILALDGDGLRGRRLRGKP